MTAGAARPALWWPLLAALVAALISACTPLAEPLSRTLVDAQLRWLAPDRSPAGVLVVGIDDASLAQLAPELGPWPLGRDAYALAAETLRSLGAKAIAIDLVLADARPGDAALARVRERPGAPVLLAAAGLREPVDTGPQPVATLPHAHRAQAEPTAANWPAIVGPTHELTGNAPQAVGVVTTMLDSDGVLRRLHLWHSAQGQRLPSLPLALWWAAKADSGAPQPDWPLDGQGRILLALSADAGRAETLPFAELMQVAFGRAPAATQSAVAARVQGRAVVIGSNTMLSDRVMTAAGQAEGSNVLAQAYAALDAGRVLRPPAGWAQALLVAVALLPLAWVAGRRRIVPRADAAALAAAAILVTVLALAFGFGARMPLSPLPGWLALAAGGLGLAWIHQRSLAAQARALAYERSVAEAANAAKTRFLATVSHEIRTPLNAVLGTSELLAATPLSAVQRRHVEVFQQAGQTLHEFINDLLDLSRIEAGRLELEHAPFSLPALLRRVAALIEPRAQQRGIDVVLDIRPGLPDGVDGDRRRLQQVLLNLLGNAVKFTREGEVRLTAQPVAGDAQRVRLEVSDTGIGIAPSRIDAIFEPFAQADEGIARDFGGTGLGLAITRALVQAMDGGHIEVHSTPGTGSRFLIELRLPPVPLTALAAEAVDVADAQPARPEALPVATGARPLEVLLAEDNDVNAYIFVCLLEQEAVHIDRAPNGPTALQMALERRYDVIFMDEEMPGMDGLGVTRALRQHEAETGRARTPVVALTANAYPSDVQRCLAAGCDRHLSKPVSRVVLVNAIRRLVSAPIDDAAAPVGTPTAVAGAGVVDESSAIARLGGDPAAYRRVREHAAVFITRWPQVLDAALSAGHWLRVRELAHDLNSTAAAIGAWSLSDAARDLEQDVLGRPDQPPSAGPLAALRSAIGPVIVELTRER